MNKIVLIADSEPEWTEVADRFLSRYGYDVVTATDGLECIKKYRELSPEILVLEDEMPWGDGEEVIDVICEHQNELGFLGQQELTILLTTTQSRDEIETLEKKPYVSAVLQKPFGLSELREAILESSTSRVTATDAFLTQAQQLLAATIAPSILYSVTKPLN